MYEAKRAAVLIAALGSIILVLAPLDAPAKADTQTKNQTDSDTQSQQQTAAAPAAPNGSGTTTEIKTEIKTEVKPSAAEKNPPPLAVTEHTLTVDGKTLHYRVTAGYLPQKDADGEKTLANVFFIAYTRTDVGPDNKRPVTFSFNGGPGSASIWLHMGALGPKRVVMSESGETLAPPYQLADNPWTWLDETDLVFIDPVSTGYSRVTPGEDKNKFHGYEEDIKSVGDFIRLYATRYNRWASPKFIIGESYGGARAAGLSEYLQDRYGMYCNGIILVSPAFDFQSLIPEPGNEFTYALFLPTYTAAAWYHHRLHGDWAQTLSGAVSSAERFAREEYAPALLRGDTLSATEREKIVARLAELTSLPQAYILQRDLRIDPEQFEQRLLTDENRIIGRFDARITGMAFEPGDSGGYDPSYVAVSGGYTAGFYDYVRRTLKFDSDLPYEVLTDVSPWKMPEGRYLHAGETLRHAMIKNTYLRVWVVSGFYDLAVPYFTVQQTLGEMNLDRTLHDHVRQTCYQSGHMVYTVPAELVKLKRDYHAWLAAALDGQPLPPVSAAEGCGTHFFSH